MTKKIVTFDLETVPDSERSESVIPLVLEEMEKFPERRRHEDEVDELTYRMATRPEFCRIVSAALAVNDQPVHGSAVGLPRPDREPMTEVGLLKSLWRVFEKANHVVAYNGLWFDLRVLKFRSALLGVAPTRPDWVDLKPWDKSFVDVFRLLYPKSSRTLSLKKAVSVFNLPVPAEFRQVVEAETDGGDVARLWAEKDLDSLVTYNRMDVALTREMCRLFGGLFWPLLFRPWGKEEYDYQAGRWICEPPEIFK